MKLGFIGLGNMSYAIIQGLKNSNNFDMHTIYASARNQKKLKERADTLNINTLPSNQELIDTVDVVFLGVKPEDLKSLNLNLKDKPIVSMAAKTTIDDLIQIFGDRSIVRIMPNLNASINMGTTAYLFHNTSDELHNKTIEILNIIGDAYEVEEHQMSGFIALAGSSPALIYRFIDMLAKSALNEGFSKEDALQIVSKTMIGSAKYLSLSEDDPQTLINKVASKGGTTREGLNVFDKRDFDSIIKESAQAIIEKDKLG